MSRRVTCAAISAFCLLASFGTGAEPAHHAPQGQKQLSPAEFQQLLDLLKFAIRTRVTPFTNFQISGEHSWRVMSERISPETLIVTYSPTPELVFYLQSIHCSHEKLGQHDDATILGPTETAAEFYQANIVFATYPPDDFFPCLVDNMATTDQEGVVRREGTSEKGVIVTSHGRVIRHMVNWLRVLNRQSTNAKSSADFFATILDKEEAELLRFESKQDYDRTKRELSLFEYFLPSSSFPLDLPLNEQEKVQVREFLTTRIRLRRKLRVFLTDADQRIKADETLLASFP